MTEQVLITPLAGRRNSDGDPLPAGTPFNLTGLVAPGNTAERPGTGGETETVDFTFYTQQPRVWTGSQALPIVEALTDNFDITIRGKRCRGRVQAWTEYGGGTVILASRATGKGA